GGGGGGVAAAADRVGGPGVVDGELARPAVVGQPVGARVPDVRDLQAARGMQHRGDERAGGDVIAGFRGDRAGQGADRSRGRRGRGAQGGLHAPAGGRGREAAGGVVPGGRGPAVRVGWRRWARRAAPAALTAAWAAASGWGALDTPSQTTAKMLPLVSPTTPASSFRAWTRPGSLTRAAAGARHSSRRPARISVPPLSQEPSASGRPSRHRHRSPSPTPPPAAGAPAVAPARTPSGGTDPGADPAGAALGAAGSSARPHCSQNRSVVASGSPQAGQRAPASVATVSTGSTEPEPPRPFSRIRSASAAGPRWPGRPGGSGRARRTPRPAPGTRVRARAAPGARARRRSALPPRRPPAHRAPPPATAGRPGQRPAPGRAGRSAAWPPLPAAA